MDVVGQYAWDATALAFLYQALSKVVRLDHQHLSGSATLLLLRNINHASDLVREDYNSKNWDLIEKALDVLKMYDPEVAGEDVSKELKLDDKMDDNTPV
ncbi:hypothetical protein AMTR_s00033p00227350 [Amborella trichopoda]|uniref:Uncharacterized protein n=1 Tax=Amborella trichopoda TaxID=13333 RepID=U5CMK7_AMBTC|nr:hypothetical protein AMTR_s00033p00227350 [Amborella trichopoda]